MSAIYKNTLYIAILSILFTSCASQKELANLERAKTQFETKAKECEENLKTKLEEIADLNRQLVEKDAIIEGLKQDTTNKRKAYKQLALDHSTTKELYESVNNNYNDLLSSSSSKARKMMIQLGDKEQTLINKEKELNELALSLGEKEQTINQLLADLEARERKVNELQGILAKKDSAVNALKNTILNALKGMNDGDLQVRLENGKVYVTLSNKILFKSGSTTIDEAGVGALGKLAKVLNDNPDIHITVEGHTDTDKGLDNWDLSVKRATEIVRILTVNNSVDPKRVIASGRGEFHPVDTNETAEGKSNNRRTEIILTPDLDELFEILEGNEQE